LSAVELDRLTIDGNGRFYWDGRLVNYEPPKEKLPDTREQSAMYMIDRAAHDLSDQQHAEPTEDAELSHAVEPPHQPEESSSAVDFDMVRPVPDSTVVHDGHDADSDVTVATHVTRGSDVTRLKLSRWQSLGAILLVLGVVIGAAGMAAYGFLAVHDWGCRTGMVQNYCVSTPGHPSSRSDIPA
jgi:hypothetical protein